MTNNLDASQLQDECALPFNYRARFEWSLTDGMAVRWHPKHPVIKTARGRAKFFEAYCEKRNAFYQKVASDLGVSMGVMDVLPEDKGYGLTVFEPATRH